MDILNTLKNRPIWLKWKEEPAVVPGKKPRKVPCYVDGGYRTGPLDSPADRQRLVTYDEALQSLSQSRDIYAGLGIALGPDGHGGWVQGIDLDDIERNGLSDIANDWVRGDHSGLGYVEASPSGKGLHILGYGRHFRSLGSNATGIEAYASGRFFTFTGNAARTSDNGAPIDLAEYVETVLISRHQKQGASSSVHLPPTFVGPSTITDLRSALLHLRADDRDLWVRMGMALRELGEDGRGLWLEWSATSEKFEPLDAARVWDSLKPSTTSYQAVFAEAQRQRWLNPSSNRAQSTLAGQGPGKPLSIEPEEWPDPIPLPSSLLPVAPFDLGLLPEALRPWIGDITERMQVPLICPPLSGPETMIAWTTKGTLNAKQETQSGRDYREAA